MKPTIGLLVLALVFALGGVLEAPLRLLQPLTFTEVLGRELPIIVLMHKRCTSSDTWRRVAEGCR